VVHERDHKKQKQEKQKGEQGEGSEGGEFEQDLGGERERRYEKGDLKDADLKGRQS
jgi:hypothetical protein